MVDDPDGGTESKSGTSDTAGNDQSLAEALLDLHGPDTIGVHGGLDDAINAVANAPETEMSLGTKVEALLALARKDFPGGIGSTTEDSYANLTKSIAPELEHEQVLADFQEAAAAPDNFGNTATGRHLKTHHYAFLGQDCVCKTTMVSVDGRPAAWIFAEFNTDASLEECRKWMEPENWPVHSPTLFKGMRPKDADRAQGTADRWHGSYIETVALPLRVETSLHFDYSMQDSSFVGLSYALDLRDEPRGDGKFDVDRGFLSINDLGDVRHIKILKIVGFADRADLNTLATHTCPLWTEFAKGAVVGSTMSTCAEDLNDSLRELNEFTMATAAENLEIGERWMREAMSKEYGINEFTRDAAGAWLKLAHDWTNLWAKSYTAMESVAVESPIANVPKSDQYPSGFAPPSRDADEMPSYVGSVRPAGANNIESIIVPVPNMPANARCRLGGDFRRLGAAPLFIAADDIRVAVVTLGAGRRGVLLRVDTRSLREGLYSGTVEFQSGSSDAGTRTAPLHFYVSRAIRA